MSVDVIRFNVGSRKFLMNLGRKIKKKKKKKKGILNAVLPVCVSTVFQNIIGLDYLLRVKEK